MEIGETVVTKNGRKLEIVAIRNYFDIDVLIDDKYLREHAIYGNFKSGNVRSPFQPLTCGVGYMGVGEYRSKDENGNITQAYQKWNDMMKRCYRKKSLEKNPTYKIVEVCEEWHNFQNFARWFYENKINVKDEEIHIDKDIIDGESKIYSPETCCIVPKTINALFIRGRKVYDNRNELPTGVVPHYTTYMAQVSIYGKRKRGYFKTPEEAFQWYKVEKEKHIKEVTERYKDVLPQRTYDALMNYEVKPYPFTEEELVS